MLIKRILLPLDRLMNRMYGSEYNPLYRSGTLAVALLSFVLVTGVYLLFFYRVGAPYESMQNIQAQVWFGRWIRAAHRYASDLALVAVFFHILRMILQGKTWGRRTLAWVSGVILMLFMFISAWTGYVMVWDEHGQLLAQVGAEMLDVLPIFSVPIGRSFSGTTPIASSFFFMNLFLHVAIPLGMIFGLWFHTSRLARTSWFPARHVFLALIGATLVLSIVWPAPLTDKADLLAVVERIPVDGLFGFWLPVALTSPAAALALWIFLVLALISIPWWLKPKKEKQPEASFNDPKACQGCRQCVIDCPYEAIEMVPRPEGMKGSPEVALVTEDVCVSCGICAASCSSLTIGPPERKAPDQVARLKEFVAVRSSSKKSDDVLIMVCGKNEGVLSALERFADREGGFAVHSIDCVGTLHASVVDLGGRRFAGGVAVVSCSSANCENREGPQLFKERLEGIRTPTVRKLTDRNRVAVFSVAAGEEKQLFAELTKFKSGHSSRELNQEIGFGRSGVQKVSKWACTVLLLLGVGFLSQVPMGEDLSHGILRLSWRLPGQAHELCDKRSQEELENIPFHMRRPNCEKRYLTYQLLASVDGKQVINHRVEPAGLRGDRPLYVREEVSLPPGEYDVEVSFVPVDDLEEDVTELRFQGQVIVREGFISLVTRGDGDLVFKKSFE